MKYFLIILAIFSAGVFCSCEKTRQQTFSPVDTRFNYQTTEPISFASEWQTAKWQIASMDDGSNILRGEIRIDEKISSDHANDVKLVFLRIRGREEYVYQSLPTLLQTMTGNFQMNSDFSRQRLTIRVFSQRNEDDDTLIQPEISEVDALEYQYIFVPVEIFTKVMIDWTNYQIVQETLHI
jgi:hypothetical protein